MKCCSKELENNRVLSAIDHRVQILLMSNRLGQEVLIPIGTSSRCVEFITANGIEEDDCPFSKAILNFLNSYACMAGN